MVEGSELRRALVAQMSATASNQDRIESYQILEQFKKINPGLQVKAIGQLSQDNDENIKHAAKGIVLSSQKSDRGYLTPFFLRQLRNLFE